MANENTGGKMKKYMDGEVIFQEKTFHPYMYKVLRGKVALYMNYGDPHETVLGLLGQDKYFGEVSILTGKSQIYTAVAMQDTLLLKVSEDQLESFLNDNRTNTADIMRSMAQVLVTQNTNISLLLEDLKEILKQLPKETKLDSNIEIRLKQYQLKYVGRNTLDAFIKSEQPHA